MVIIRFRIETLTKHIKQAEPLVIHEESNKDII